MACLVIKKSSYSSLRESVSRQAWGIHVVQLWCSLGAVAGCKNDHSLLTLLLSQVDEGTMDESFLDLISKCQGHRLDDQRSEFPSPLLQSADRSSQASSEEDDLFETLWRLQGSRIEEQRCQLPPIAKAAAPTPGQRWQEPPEVEALSSDELFELIFASQVRSYGVS